MGQRLAHLDVLRGIAILLVLCRHAPLALRLHPFVDQVFEFVQRIGYAGVDLFFVLSGFLIGGMLLKEMENNGRIDILRFWIRRWFKIWPGFLIMVIAYCMVCPIFSQPSESGENSFAAVLGDVWPNFLHIQNYFSCTDRIGFTWSLAVEEHFYTVLPVLLLFIGRRVTTGANSFALIWRLSLFVAIGCLIFRGLTRIWWETPSAYIHYSPTHLRIDSLFAGVFLAGLVRYRTSDVERLRPFYLLFAFVGVGGFVCVGFVPAYQGSPIAAYTIYPFDCALLIASSSCLVLWSHFADTNFTVVISQTWRGALATVARFPIARVGLYSYSIYLWHGYFAPPVSKRIMWTIAVPINEAGISSCIHFAVYVFVCVVLGVVMATLIEVPFLRFRDRMIPARIVNSNPMATSSPKLQFGSACATSAVQQSRPANDD